MPDSSTLPPSHISIDKTPDQLAEEIRSAIGGQRAAGFSAYEAALRSVVVSGRDTIAGTTAVMSGNGLLVSVSLPTYFQEDSTESLAESIGILTASLLRVQRTAKMKGASGLAVFRPSAEAGSNE